MLGDDGHVGFILWGECEAVCCSDALYLDCDCWLEGVGLMRAILPFMGFTETGSRACGMEDLWFHVLRPLASGSVTIYHPQEWSKNVHGILAQMRRLGIAEVMVIGYSWGGGAGAMNFARAARQYGIHIPVVCLCDPVYRSRFLPSWLPLNPLSMTRIPRISVPMAVDQVWWVRQKMNRPAGHHLVAENPSITTIHPGEFLEVRHEHIDEHPQWIDLVMRQSRVFVGGMQDFLEIEEEI